MAVKIGHASIDERGKIAGGSAGDQTKKELCIRDWYAKGWNVMVRAKDPEVAEKIAKAMEDACANDYIGYDQNQRTTLYIQAKNKSWKLTRITTKCECDCSSLVAVCVNVAGIAVSKDIYTGDMVRALKNTGAFEVLTDSKYLTSDKYVKRGDILVKEGSHTAVVLGTGAPSGAPKAEPTIPALSISLPDLVKGDKGDWVKVLQRLLISHGYSVGSSGVDGSFGGATERAVEKFQTDNNIPIKYKGTVGMTTWAYLVN